MFSVAVLLYEGWEIEDETEMNEVLAVYWLR